jgi:hypothetical protein
MEINIESIESKIQSILDSNHKLEQKKKIKKYPNLSNPNRLNFACPICGDSEKFHSKKRGNLYLDNLRYVCFNCDTKMSFVKFCENFNIHINMDEKIDIYNHIDKCVKYNKTDYDYTILDKLINIDEWVQYMNTRTNSWLIGIKPVQNNSHVYQYLKYKRYISIFDNIYEGLYRIVKDGKVVYKTPVMILLNRNKDKLLGIQLRNLESDKSKRFYKIIEFEELYNYMNPGKILDEYEAISYNKISHFYNILNVNFERPVTIFEGFLDSLFCENSIGLVGANNDNDILNFLTEADEGLSLRFFYDRDEKGISKASKMLKKGYPVFLWNKLIEKIIEKKPDKYVAKKEFDKIIDLNDLVIKSKNPNIYNSLKLEKFFSIDDFDLLFLDKIQWKKY